MTDPEANWLMAEHDRLEYEERRLHRESMRARGGNREFEAGLKWAAAEYAARTFFDEIVAAVLFYEAPGA